MAEPKTVGKGVRKKDALACCWADLHLSRTSPRGDCLVVKVLRSPYAHALIRSIRTDLAMKVPGMAAVYTYEDVPRQRFTIAGQTYPEPSPYDRLILDRRLRFVGDAVAILAGESEAAVDKAMKLVKVDYEVLPAVLDPHTALDNPVLVHPEDNYTRSRVGPTTGATSAPATAAATATSTPVLADCDVVVDHVWHTKPCQQAMMETFRTYTEIDPYGRLHVVSSTQIVFHVRRILAQALGIPKSKIHVEKPRIGGGFGAKQTAVCEVYPAFVTWKTGRPAAHRLHPAGNARPPAAPGMRWKSTCAWAPANRARSARWTSTRCPTPARTASTAPPPSGFRGTSPSRCTPAGWKPSALPTTSSTPTSRPPGPTAATARPRASLPSRAPSNELADRLGVDPVALREQNMVREGMRMPAYYNEPANACALDRCMARCKDLFGWDEKFPVRDMGNGKVRAAGVAMAMQGSGISGVDVGSATVRLGDDGIYKPGHRRGRYGHRLRYHPGADGGRMHGLRRRQRRGVRRRHRRLAL